MHIAALRIHPIKSLPGMAVEQATIAPSGGLAGDRRYAIVGRFSRLVNAKRCKELHRIDAAFDPSLRGVTLSADGSSESFEFGDRRLDAWLSDVLGATVRLVTSDDGFPDHGYAPGPSLISRETLSCVASAFELPFDEALARFRANVVIDAGDAFAEDRLLTANGGLRGAVGSVAFEAVEHCTRCVVPTRDPRTGVATADFVKRLTALRRTSRPSWSDARSFSTWYSLAVLTRVAPTEAGKKIAIGDAVRFDQRGLPISSNADQ